MRSYSRERRSLGGLMRSYSILLRTQSTLLGSPRIFMVSRNTSMGTSHLREIHIKIRLGEGYSPLKAYS